MNKRLLITLLAFGLIAAGSWTAIQYAKGYRPNLKNKTVSATGLLVANSFPNGASVYLNDKLTTATDNTLNLPPEQYDVKIIKDGYIPWEKTLAVKKELVVQTNADLFKNAPDLQSLSSTGAINPVPSPDGLKIAFSVASSSAKNKNGLWIFDMQQKALSFSSNLRQVAAGNAEYDFSQAGIIWTPDSSQILAVFNNNNILLDAGKTNSPDSFKDVSAQLPILIKDWQDQLNKKNKEEVLKLPREMQDIASSSAKMVFFSPDGEKMLYTATASASIKTGLIPPLPASDTEPEERDIVPGRIYVYDLKEDKNFFVAEVGEDMPAADSAWHSLPAELENIQKQYSPLYFQKIQWHPSKRHLILLENKKINIMEYDGANKAAVYNGPFEDSFVYPWPDGSRLLVLTNLNKETPNISNLYAVGVK